MKNKDIKFYSFIFSIIMCIAGLLSFIMVFVPVLSVKIYGFTFAEPNLPVLAFDTNHNYTANSTGSRIVPSVLFFVVIFLFLYLIYDFVCHLFEMLGKDNKIFKVQREQNKKTLIINIVLTDAVLITLTVFAFLLPVFIGNTKTFSLSAGAVFLAIAFIIMLIVYTLDQLICFLKRNK